MIFLKQYLEAKTLKPGIGESKHGYVERKHEAAAHWRGIITIEPYVHHYFNFA